MTIRKQRGPLQRLPGADFSAAEAILNAATMLIVPDDQTQRQAFEKLMPYLYVLRNKGCSWQQLTTLLTDCGFTLQPSSVRGYYNEMLAARQDICQQRMNEQILLMAEIRKETQGADLSSITGRVTALMNQQRSKAESKLDAVFGAPNSISPKSPSAPSPAEKQNVGQGDGVGRQNFAKGRVPQTESDDFGTKEMTKAAPKTTSGSAFFDHDDGPVVPDLKPKNQTVASASISQDHRSDDKLLRCCALKPGVPSIKKRPGAPPELYLDEEIEHPSIPGLMLSLEQRLYGAALEYMTSDGEIKLESDEERKFRVIWRRPIPMTKSKTGSSFVKMDNSLFK